jgi:hypothetical protein
VIDIERKAELNIELVAGTAFVICTAILRAVDRSVFMPLGWVTERALRMTGGR